LSTLRLAGKRAVITGSSRGIGAATAKLFASQGATVVVTHRSSGAHIDGVVRSISRAGGKAIAVHGDVSDPASVERIFSTVEHELGGLDILVNYAGLADGSLWGVPLSRTTLDMWKRVFAVDAFGTFLCSKEAAGIMKKGSSIVNVASTPALSGDTEGLVYASAKGAVLSMTRMLAKMLAPKIRVNCMAFGSIKTTWVDWLSPDQRDSYLRAIPLATFGKPEDAANLALFLASDESRFITGQVIVLDGGETVH
jgi:3-oxoacyl-[acyl-carrier protein] reductase